MITITATRQFDTVSTDSTAIDPPIRNIDFGRRYPTAAKPKKTGNFIRQTSRLQFRLKRNLPTFHCRALPSSGSMTSHRIIPCVPGVKRSEREANHSRPTSVKIKNDRGYNSTPSTGLYGFYFPFLTALSTSHRL